MRNNKWLYINTTLLMISCIYLLSCTHNTQEQVQPAISFSTDITPILQASCIINSSCHSGAINSGANINFDSGAAYACIQAKQLVMVNNPTASLLYVEVNTGIMPKAPYTHLSTTDINNLLTWIKQGAKNN